MKKVLLTNILVTVTLVFIFDILAYFFLPARYVAGLTEYRNIPPEVGGNAKYPRGYFVAHEERGFDIGPNRQGQHWVDGVTYPIWSNSLGCFDREHDIYENYVYFAGDSYTWGYTPYEDKFGTIIEQVTGTQVLKCGVTHTGQKHQYEKLVETVDRIEVSPDAIFVFHVPNDIANDFTHPHSTVIQGWQVNTVSLDKNFEPVRHSQQELEEKMQQTLAEQASVEADKGLWSNLKSDLKRYSLSVSILVYIKDRIKAARAQQNAPDTVEQSRSSNIYALPNDRDGVYWYLDNPRTQNNRDALLDFARFAREADAEFVVVLIPPLGNSNLDWYAELHQFLNENGIRFLDLAAEFDKRQLTHDDLYWAIDGHLKPSGKRHVAEILLERFPDIFKLSTN